MHMHLEIFSEFKENTLQDIEILKLNLEYVLMVPDFSFSDVSWKRLAKEPEFHFHWIS